MKKNHIVLFLFLTILLAGCVFASNDTSMDVSADKDTVKMGDTIEFTATKYSEDTSNVVFKVNKKTVTDNNGTPVKSEVINNKAKATYTVPDGMRAGIVNVSAVSNIDGNRVVSNTTFNVEKMNTRFTNITVYRSLDSFNINALILDDNNHTMYGSAKVAIKINGKTYDRDGQPVYFKASNGLLNATIKLSKNFLDRDVTLMLVTGDTYSYIGTRHVVENLKDGSIEVKRLNINFINTTINREKNSISISSYLVDDNNHTVKDTSKVAIKLNNKTLQENGTPKYFYAVNGVLNVTFDIGSGLSNRDLSIMIVTGDTYSYIGKRVTYESIVNYNSLVNVESVIIRNQSKVSVPFNVTNTDGKILTDGNITVYLNNKYYTQQALKSENIITLNELGVGTYNLSIFYTSDKYLSSNNTCELKVTGKHKTRSTMMASVFVKLYTTVTSSDVQKWVDSGITDVMVQTYTLSKNTAKLKEVISLCKNTNIKVHAWVICFKYDGKWYNTPEQEKLTKDFISELIKIDGVDGICLDYVRYSGTNPSVTNHSRITNFVKDVYNLIKDYDSELELSACVFAEKAGTKTYYGQDYVALSEYLDFIMPMAYKYSYNANRNWLIDVTRYIYDRTSKAKVVTIIQTYKDEEATQLLSVNEITEDINAVMSAGSYGYSLFYKTAIKEYPKIF